MSIETINRASCFPALSIPMRGYEAAENESSLFILELSIPMRGYERVWYTYKPIFPVKHPHEGL